MPHRSISDIKHIILKPALTHLFLVQFPIPGNLANVNEGLRNWMLNYTDLPLDPLDNGVTDKISLLCSEANLPGSSLLTHEINNDFTGQTERHAYRRSYDDRIDFTFYVDERYDIVKFFHNWITFIVNDKAPKEEQASYGINQKTYNSRVRFPSDYYTQEMKIIKFEKSIGLKDYPSGFSTPSTGTYGPQVNEQENVLVHSFVNAYPISINSIPVSYDQPSLLKCTVSFTYSRYYVALENASNFSKGDPD